MGEIEPISLQAIGYFGMAKPLVDIRDQESQAGCLKSNQEVLTAGNGTGTF